MVRITVYLSCLPDLVSLMWDFCLLDVTVIEKCIINASDHEINMIAGEVVAPGLDGNTGIQAMLRHDVGKL